MQKNNNYYNKMKKKDSQRLIIIGIDGAPYRFIKKFTENNIMPNLKSIIENGVFSKMQSTIPEISSISWSSIITGKNPAEHGIFGFTDFPEGTYRLSFPNFTTLKSPPFWKIDDKRRSIIINVPTTYPANELNGIIVSGFVALDLEMAVYPTSFIPKLRKINYKIDVDFSLAHKSIELFIKNLDETLDARIKLFHYLWDNEEWQNFMFVFTGSDRLFHFCWDAYEDENHKYHKVYLNHFNKIDKVIGKIKNTISDNDLLILLSDHGFETLDKNININYLLKKNGFLKLKDNSRPNFHDIDFGTKAFALDPSRIYINLKDKYPCGSVAQDNYNIVIEDIIKLFNDLKINGKHVIKKIFKKEEIYKGSYFNQAPDLVLLGNTGINLKGSIDANNLQEKNIFTGKHTQPDAFFIVNQSSIKNLISNDFNVSNVLDIIDKFHSRS